MTRGDTYLGDGLYASFDGDQICLWCERDSGKHMVYLDGQVLQAFERYVAALKAELSA